MTTLEEQRRKVEPTLVSCATWEEVLKLAKADPTTLWYWSPLSYRPSRLGFSIGVKVGRRTVRISPPRVDGDPFTADKGHLDRFYRKGL